MRQLFTGIALCAALATLTLPACGEAKTYEAEVLPSERVIVKDEITGAELLFATQSSASDVNLYFHQCSWLPDESMLVFTSDRTGKREIFGYIEATGELVRLQRNVEKPVHYITASRHRNSLYLIQSKRVLEWQITIEPSSAPEKERSKVVVRERVVCKMPEDTKFSRGINESCDGKGLIVGLISDGPHESRIVWIDLDGSTVKEIAAVDFSASHIQASWTRSDLVSFARHYAEGEGDWALTMPEDGLRARMWLADLSDRPAWPIYPQVQGELVTHECWWVDDQITFCSGQFKDGHAEHAHVKVHDLKTGKTHIVGAGSWWEDPVPKETARVNWWHAAGSPDGRFVAGDNWHGDVVLFSAQTARVRGLTRNHRTYGKGSHPHMGWSPSSRKVVMGSDRFGNPDVCIVTVPGEWRTEEW